MDARITITTNSNGHYTALQKGSTGAFTVEQIKKAADIARIKGEEIRNKLKELPKTG
jgi:exosome complex component RRP42